MHRLHYPLFLTSYNLFLTSYLCFNLRISLSNVKGNVIYFVEYYFPKNYIVHMSPLVNRP